ncbi:MAG: SH3 domain-containing protein [Chloroherpetonaceae bacterium]|nr:SH3 domain-containing protein [Chloroherpetonaceae bacterium]MDW8438059.1 SH3 domain-containing protein [Chloroherpetonaceae bacterium]
MLKRACFSALLAAMATSLLAQISDPKNAFQEANNLYAAGKYRDALALYRALDSLGYQSGELYYNLGNAHYKLGQIGLAILYYEKARLFIEGDEDLETNLELARAKTKDKIPELPKFFLEAFLDGALDRFSLGWLGFLTAFFLYALAAVFILQLRQMFGLNSLAGNVAKHSLLVLFAFSLLFFALKSVRVASRQKAIVLSPVVNLKSEPREQSATISVVHEGLKVDITRREEGWLEVKLPDGTKGWIERRDAGEI